MHILTRVAPIPTNYCVMFRVLASMLLCAAVFAGTSCSTIEEEPIRFSPDAFSLEGTKWALMDCPTSPYLIINGQTDCEYLSTLEFRDGMVYIKYKDSSAEVPHHICFMNGSRLTVSLQSCSSSSWRPMFEWNVIALAGENMVVDVEVPAIISDYHATFNYKRIH